MHRLVISMTAAQEARLRRAAAARGVSMASMVRDAIDDLPEVIDPERQAMIDRALEVIGKYRSGLSDIAVNHDAYLAEAFDDRRDDETGR
jgi:hypothetical protein